jgi:Bacterial aa3 type cytochrome c oxidase subunit IV
MHIDMTEANANMDMAAHVQTYRKFATLVMYSIGGLAALLILMAIFLT